MWDSISEELDLKTKALVAIAEQPFVIGAGLGAGGMAYVMAYIAECALANKKWWEPQNKRSEVANATS